MKKLFMMLCVGCFIGGMEPIGGHKERVQMASASNGSSVARVSAASDASTSVYETIDLKDTKKGTSNLGKDIILVHTQEDLERILQQQGVELSDKQSERKSIVFMPRMDLDAISTELKKE